MTILARQVPGRDSQKTPLQGSSPSHSAIELTGGGDTASIVHGGQVYTLRITRQGKLILTK